MELVTYLIILAVGGLFVGAIGRLALPGKDPMSLFMTMLIGIGGSFVAGLVSSLVIGRNAGGIIFAILCATGIVYLVRRSRGGSLTRPGRIR